MRYRIPHRLGWVVVPPKGEQPVAVYLMPLPDGDPHALFESAALIWTLAADGEADVAASLAELLSTPETELRDEVEDYLAHLVAAGLLEEVP